MQLKYQQYYSYNMDQDRQYTACEKLMKDKYDHECNLQIKMNS